MIYFYLVRIYMTKVRDLLALRPRLAVRALREERLRLAVRDLLALRE
jgi:hypothetical protein